MARRLSPPRADQKRSAAVKVIWTFVRGRAPRVDVGCLQHVCLGLCTCAKSVDGGPRMGGEESMLCFRRACMCAVLFAFCWGV